MQPKGCAPRLLRDRARKAAAHVEAEPAQAPRGGGERIPAQQQPKAQRPAQPGRCTGALVLAQHVQHRLRRAGAQRERAWAKLRSCVTRLQQPEPSAVREHWCACSVSSTAVLTSVLLQGGHEDEIAPKGLGRPSQLNRVHAYAKTGILYKWCLAS